MKVTKNQSFSSGQFSGPSTISAHIWISLRKLRMGPQHKTWKSPLEIWAVLMEMLRSYQDRSQQETRSHSNHPFERKWLKNQLLTAKQYVMKKTKHVLCSKTLILIACFLNTHYPIQFIFQTIVFKENASCKCSPSMTSRCPRFCYQRYGGQSLWGYRVKGEVRVSVFEWWSF